jgi:hypothetical protein
VRKAALATALAAALLLPLAAQAAELVAPDATFPPWQHGQNNDAAQRGLAFKVPEVDDLTPAPSNREATAASTASGLDFACHAKSLPQNSSFQGFSADC